jgi:hypothetical protein
VECPLSVRHKNKEQVAVCGSLVERDMVGSVPGHS